MIIRMFCAMQNSWIWFHQTAAKMDSNVYMPVGTAEEKVVKIQRRLLFLQKVKILIKTMFQVHLINIFIIYCKCCCVFIISVKNQSKF